MNTVYENPAYGQYVLIQADMWTAFPVRLFWSLECKNKAPSINSHKTVICLHPCTQIRMRPWRQWSIHSGLLVMHTQWLAHMEPLVAKCRVRWRLRDSCVIDSIIKTVSNILLIWTLDSHSEFPYVFFMCAHAFHSHKAAEMLSISRYESVEMFISKQRVHQLGFCLHLLTKMQSHGLLFEY